MLSHASGENILVELEIAGEKTASLWCRKCSTRRSAATILHVDFHAVSMDEMIEADVPLEPTGIANGVKNFGGLLEQNLRSLAIECLAARSAGRHYGGRFRAQYRRFDSRARNSRCRKV